MTLNEAIAHAKEVAANKCNECGKELWNSGKLPDFNNDEIIEQETIDISASILKKYRY